MRIHKTSIVDKNANIGDKNPGVEVLSFSYQIAY